ncbi:MAG: diguanylate cyclase domain-containing protein [Pontibacterium sp.]
MFKRSLTIVQSLFALPLVALGVAIGCWVVLFWSEARQDEMLARAEYTNQLQHQINLLRGELHIHELYRDQATLDRVAAQQARLRQVITLRAPGVTQPNQVAQAQSIRLQIDNLGVLLTMLVENPQLASGDASVDGEGYEVIVGRLIIALNNLNEDVLRMSSLILTEARVVEAQANRVVRFLLALFTGLLALFITRLAFRVKNRMHLLHSAMNTVEAGDLDKEVAVPGSDEVSDLASHFEHMRQELQSSQAERESLITKLEQQTHVLQAQTERMHHLAHHDGLTGLPNRMMFMESLERAVSQAERSQQQLAVLFIDLDGFKQINDTLGHDAGDEVLVAVSERLSNLLRKSDMVARLGGDEFVILLNPLADEKQPEQVVEKIMHNLSQPMFVREKTVRPGASIGVCIYPQEARNVTELLKKADTAMYQVKEEHKHN